MGCSDVCYSSIDGTPLRYVRTSPPITPYTVCSESHFRQKLIWFVQDLKAATPSYYGPMTQMATAGACVNKTGAHGAGRAFDLDIVSWYYRSCSPYNGQHASSNLAIRRRYVGVDAFCRRQFKYVLDGWYNLSHTDHIHVDNYGGSRVLDKGYRSDVVFVQAALNNLMGANLSIDGVYGPNTDSAYRESKLRLGVTGDTSSSPAVWLDWLYKVGIRGLNDWAI